MKKTIFIIVNFIIFSVTGFEVSAQQTSTGAMPQYLFPEFNKCKVLMKAGQIQSPVMNYNIVTGKMVFTTNDTYYDLTNTGAIDTIILNGCKFVPAGKFFYEVVLPGPLALFIQHRGNLMSAGKQVGYGGTSQTASTSYVSSIELSGFQANIALPSDYIVNPSPVYWIRKGDVWMDFTTEKQFLAHFPDKISEIKAFIKGNRIKIDKKENLIKLVNFCASL